VNIKDLKVHDCHSSIAIFDTRKYYLVEDVEKLFERSDNSDYTKCSECKIDDIVWHGTCGKCGCKWTAEKEHFA